MESFVTIRPKQASLNGYIGEPVETSVTIISNEKYPFNIVDVHAKNGQYIKYHLEESNNSGNKTYELKIENQKAEAGRYDDTIVLKTDSKVKPQLDIRVYGSFRPRPKGRESSTE